MHGNQDHHPTINLTPPATHEHGKRASKIQRKAFAQKEEKEKKNTTRHYFKLVDSKGNPTTTATSTRESSRPEEGLQVLLSDRRWETKAGFRTTDRGMQIPFPRPKPLKVQALVKRMSKQ